MLCPTCRALRQNREAAALGLLEGHKQRGGEDGDIEVCSHAHPSSCQQLSLHMQLCTACDLNPGEGEAVDQGSQAAAQHATCSPAMLTLPSACLCIAGSPPHAQLLTISPHEQLLSMHDTCWWLRPGSSGRLQWSIHRRAAGHDLLYKVLLQVETQRDRSLPRRIQSLQRFLLEQLHKEASQQLGIASTTASPSPTLPLASSSTPAAPGSVASTTGAGLQAEPQAVAVTLTATGSGVSVALAAQELSAGAGLSPEVAVTPQSGGRGLAGSMLSPAGGSPEPAQRQQQQAGSPRTVVDQTFGLLMQQHTQCLTGSRPVKDRQVKSFQVSLALACCKAV